MIPVILLQPPEPPPPPALVETMLASCSSGLERGRCTQHDAELAPEEEVRAVVVIRVEEDGSALLQIGDPSAPEAEWTRQPVSFQENDPAEERYTTLGLLAASLAVSSDPTPWAAVPPGNLAPEPASRDESAGAAREQREAEALPSSTTGAEAPNSPSSENAASRGPDGAVGGDSTQPARAEENPAAQERAADVSSTSSLRPYLAAGASLGRGFVDEVANRTALRPGALVRMGLSHGQFPVEVEGGAGWSMLPRTPDGLSASYLTFELGPAYRLRLPRTRMILRAVAHLLAEQVRASARSADESTKVQQSRWLWGVGLGGGLAYPVTPRLSTVLEAEYLHYDGATGIEVNGTRLGRVPAANFRALFGLTYQL